MKTKARAPAAALNREIIDDRGDRLAIHTHEIRLTQANLPYQAVAGKRLASTKHFAVFADRITLGGTLQNPGRDIELNAREIIIEAPTTFDVAGALADKDFAPGAAPVQKDPKPGDPGTDGDNGTVGGAGGRIVITAQRVVNKAGDAKGLSASEVAALGAQVLSQNPPKIDNACSIPSFELGRVTVYAGYTMAITLEDGRIEGLAKIGLESARLDGPGQIVLILDLPSVTLAGKVEPQQLLTRPFGFKIHVAAAVGEDGKVGVVKADAVPATGGPVHVRVSYLDQDLSDAVLASLGEKIAAHLKGAVEALMLTFAQKLRASTLVLLAGGGRGGRGQDGHGGIRGESGSEGPKTSKPGALVDGHYGFPPEATGGPGKPGGRAGSPGLSADGGPGGQILLNVMEPAALAIVYNVGGGEGGALASPGERGPGGWGGAGAMCKMFDYPSGKPLEDMRAPSGPGGPPGPPASRAGSQGKPGANGGPLQVNGKAFTGGEVPKLSYADLAQSLSLSQLLMTQNVTDVEFLNTELDPKLSDEQNQARLAPVAQGYVWLVDINQPFTRAAAGIDPKRVSPAEQKVRAGLFKSALVSLMRLQQGFDYYGNGYNWAPILNLTYLVDRTQQIIELGKVVEDQFNRFLDTKSAKDERMKAFTTAKQEIDRKLAEFRDEIEALKPQIQALQAQVDDYTKDLVKQRTVVLTGQLKFQDELVRYLRKQDDLSLEDFLDILGSVLGCAAGFVGTVGVKTAFDAFKKAEEFGEKAKNIVEMCKKAKETVDSVKKVYAGIKDMTKGGDPDSAKIIVDGEKFDKMLKDYLDKVDAAGELRQAMDYYTELAQARNTAAYNYTALVAQLQSLQAQHDQLYSGIQHINAEIAANQDNVLPIYTAFLKDAYDDLKRSLLRNIYLENRAYQYWSLKDRKLTTDDLNIATLAATHQRLIGEIDHFREGNEAFSDFTQEVTISPANYPNEFAAMLESKSLAFALDIRDLQEEAFENLRYVTARSFTLVFPDLKDSKKVLTINLIHSGQAVLNSDTNLAKNDALHAFSHRPRTCVYKIDYKNPKNSAGGNLGEEDQGYIGLSPFTQWRIDFRLRGNDWLVLEDIKSIELMFEGRALGPGRSLQ